MHLSNNKFMIMNVLKFYRSPKVFASLLFLLITAGYSCKMKSAQADTGSTGTMKVATSKTYNYDLTKWSGKWELPAGLLEISGNAYVDKDHLLVIEDMHPNLYLLKLLDGKAEVEKTIPFKNDPDGAKFDIEDVAINADVAYALWSHGTVYKISDWRNNPKTEEFTTSLSKKSNTEGMCFDPATNSLLIATKGASGIEDEKKSTKAIYKFDLSKNALEESPFFIITKDELKSPDGDKIKLNPSAIAIHPITKDIYILSTKGSKCMAIFSSDGKFKSLQMMERTEFLQPEGICFSPEGLLFISTEGKDSSPAFIYSFNPGKL